MTKEMNKNDKPRGQWVLKTGVIFAKLISSPYGAKPSKTYDIYISPHVKLQKTKIKPRLRMGT